MNVKRFRAASMRAALEQARARLGADALVLETREVHSGGFLGLGRKPMVELSVIEKPSAAGQTVAASFPLRPDQTRPVESRMHRESGSALKLPTSPDAEIPEERQQRTQGWMGDTSAPPSGADPPSALKVGRERVPVSHFFLPAGEIVAESVGEGRRVPLSDRSRMGEGISSFEDLWLDESRALQADIPEFSRPAEVNRGSTSAGLETRNPLAGKAEDVTGGAPASSTSQDSLHLEFNRLRAELRTELRLLGSSLTLRLEKEVMEKQTDAEESIPDDSPYPETLRFLLSSGLPERLARRAVSVAAVGGLREVRDLRTIARAGLAGALPSVVRFADDSLTSAPTQSSVSIVIGPTGVGKTTTIAKLAARAVWQLRRRVELITLDTWRIAASEQLRMYAEMIGAGFHVARSVDALERLVQHYSDKATVLVDTAGSNPLDLDDNIELSEYLATRRAMHRYLVLPATINSMDAEFALAQAKMCGADRLIITKLDESLRPGQIVSTAASAGIPLAWLCMGRRVPEDLQRATPLSFATCVTGVC